MYFSFDGEEFEIHNTEQEARDCAEDAIANYRDEAMDGWADESMHVCWGKVTQFVKVTEERRVEAGDCVTAGIDTWQKRELVDCEPSMPTLEFDC